ncbi:MAG: NADPH:quinone oxidoreductase family protein [Hyphomicrobiaceae bacterium]
MRAALVTSIEPGSQCRIADLAPPETPPGSVLVDVEAVALNFMDTLITRGRYQIKPELPFSPGAEIAGRVSEVGRDVDRSWIGKRVAGYVGFGGARERVVVEPERLSTIPDSVAAEVAAGVSVTYGTAMYGLKTRARVAPGDVIAVLGAAGGAGLAAVEVAKRLGAAVIAVASTHEKLAIAKAHGADEGIVCDAGASTLKDDLRAATSGAPTVIYDCIGGYAAQAALRALRPGGRFLVIGFASGDIPQLPANIVMLKDCDVLGINWGGWASGSPAVQRALVDDVLGWIAAGALTPHVHAVRPLDEINAAIDDLRERRVSGKIVLQVARRSL